MSFKAHRLNQLKESVIRNMSLVARKHKAINWAQGLPEDDAPASLKKACIEAIQDGYNQYPRTWGIPELGKALEQKLAQDRQWDIDAETMMTICCGGTEGMMASFLATLNPGDEVLILSPFYENFRAELIICGAVPVFVPMLSDSHLQFSVDWNALEKAVTPQTKAFVLNTPHNPTGKVFNISELNRLAEFVRRHHLLVFTDETYEYMVYPGHEHISFATLPGMQSCTISIGSLSKTYATTGWRVAWVIAPQELTQGIRAIHDFLTIAAPHPMQKAAIAALELPQSYYDDLIQTYLMRKDLICQGLDELKLKFSQPQGAYYVLWDIHSFLKAGETCSEFALRLTQEAKLATVPGAAFTDGDSHWVRLSFCKKKDTLVKGLAHLGQWLQLQNNGTVI